MWCFFGNNNEGKTEVIWIILEIRPERKEEYPTVYNIVKLAFQSDEEPKLIEAIRKLENFIPELSIVAMKNYTIVGHILFSPIIIVTKTNDIPALTLAPLSVHPDYQNIGIGSKLVKYGLEECKRLGHEISVVVGHPNYYPKFGFSPAREKGLESPFPVPDEAFMVVGLIEGALDGIEGTVKYSSAFDEIIWRKIFKN